MNIRFTFASDKGNVVAVKKDRGSDAFKFKPSASLKRVTLEVESRTRIDKSDTRSRFISKRSLPRKLRRKATSSSEHLEDQIEDSDDFDIHDDLDLIDVDNDEDNNPPQARQPRAKTTKDQGLEAYQADLRRLVCQRNILARNYGSVIISMREDLQKISLNCIHTAVIIFVIPTHAYNTRYLDLISQRDFRSHQHHQPSRSS